MKIIRYFASLLLLLALATPSWAQFSGAGAWQGAASSGAATNVVCTLCISLTTEVSGVLPLANGGTASTNIFGAANTWAADQIFERAGNMQLTLGNTTVTSRRYIGTNASGFYLGNNRDIDGGILDTGLAVSAMLFDVMANNSVITFYTSAANATLTETMRLDKNGNLGVGDATPDHKLDVNGNIGMTAGGYLHWGDTDGTTGYGLFDNAGSIEYKNSGGAWVALNAVRSVAQGGTGTGGTLTGLMRGSATAMTAAELSGDATTSGSNAVTIAANAVTAGKSAVVMTRRTCTIVVGADNGSVLVDADLAQADQCYVPYAATVVEVFVKADGGTPNAIANVKNVAGTASSLTSSALATAAAGARACSNAGGTTGLDATTTCSGTLQNTSVAAGSTLGLTSGTAGGTAKRMSIAITYTVN